MHEEHIRPCLDRLAQALTAGDARAAADCWDFPALILSDQSALVVTEASAIAHFFAQNIDWYRAHGLRATTPQLERVELLSEKLTAVDVRWPAFDDTGTEQASERSHYILQRGEDGQQRIRVALTRTA